MARFLLTVLPLDSHVNPNMALAHALHQRGHEVAFYTGPGACPSIGQEGFQCFAFQRVDAALVHRALDCVMLHRGPGLRTASRWREFTLGTVNAQVEDLRYVFQRWRPDVVVCDMALWGPILVLQETESVPVVVFSHIGYCILPGRDGPALGVPLRRPRRLPMKLLSRVVSKAVGLATSGVWRQANKIRRGHGLAPLTTSVTEFTGTMPLYLVPSAREFDYARSDLPPSVHYVGPCFWEKPRSRPVPDWAGRPHANGARIVVAEGTLFARQPSLPHLTIEALADVPHEIVIMAGEGRSFAKPHPSQTAAREVRIEHGLLLGDILPNAQAVVTNGSSEVVLAALSRGIPLVVVPSILDQPEMAWRVVECGAGLRVSSRRCSPSRLREAIARVISEPQFRQNSERIAVQMAQPGGAPHAAELLETLLA